MSRPWPAARAQRAPQLLLFLFVLGLGLFSVHARGTWVHLKTGAWIAQNGRLPFADPFSYMSAGAPWRAPDWLSDLLFYRTLERSGPWGVVALKALALAFAFAAAAPLSPRDPLVTAGALALAACGAWPGFAELPQAFDFLFVALLLRLLSSRDRFDAPLAWRVAAVQAAWANLHPAGAWVGAGLVGVKCFREALAAAPGQRLGWGALLVVACAAVFTNPQGSGAWSAELAQRPEWSVGPDLFNLYGVFLFAGAAAAWVCLQEHFFLAVSAMLLAALSLVAPSAAPLYLLACAPLAARGLGHFLEPREAGARRVALAALGLAVLGLAYAVQVALPRGRLRGFSTKDDGRGALEFLDANGVEGRMFNDMAMAPFLLWAAAPARPVFADPRPGVYDRGFVEDARQWEERWPALASSYRFDYAVVENAPSVGSPRAVDADPNWALAYFDDAARVYLRKDGAARAVLRHGFFRRLRPGDWTAPVGDEVFNDPRARVEALEETARAVTYAPYAALPALVRAYAMQRAGEPAKAQALRQVARERGLWKPEHLALDARILELRGDWREALSALRRARIAASRAGDRALESRLYAGAARLWLAHGDPMRARRNLVRALAVDPADEAADALLRRL